mmetsp:Transcript_15547/g.43082  ORF Transcript_15547/g.43082 Transcript_15547/m.43082 type:complete len:586 (+) Transcript_15547:143-1900(+)
MATTKDAFDTEERNLYFDLELRVNKCKFYRNPSNALAVIAGDVASVPLLMAEDHLQSYSKVVWDPTPILDKNNSRIIPSAADISQSDKPVTFLPDYDFIQHELQIGTRCLVHLGSSSGQIPSLMKKWANECKDNKKSTSWAEIAEYRVTFRIDVDANSVTSVLEKCRSVPGAWMLRSTKGIIRLCDPPTVKVTILMDQSKFYPTTLALLDGMILDAERIDASSSMLQTNQNVGEEPLETGERCWLHVRSNVLSLLKNLHGENFAELGDVGDRGENRDKNAAANNGKNSTGWVQLARAIPVVCEVVVNEDLLKRKANMKGALLLECFEIIDIQKHASSRYTDENYHAMHHTTDAQINLEETNRSRVPRIPRADRKERHRIFAEWLVKTYGIDFLSTGSGVLDVAGGNGELGNELWKFGVPSTLLDPEPRCDIRTVPFQVISEPLIGNGSELTGEDDANEITKNGEEKQRIKHLVETCSIIAGMHPDEATEAVIDTSMRLGKPFAILPCCVFRNLNAERITIRKQKQQQGNSGKDPFRSYSTFCHYLLRDKAPPGFRFETENLPFEGRNKVVFLKSWIFQCQEIMST